MNVLSTEQLKLVKELELLLDFGYSKISNGHFDLKMRSRKTVLFMMTGVVQSYSGAVLSLLKNGQTNGAEVLLRPIVETFINLNYIFIYGSEKNALRFIFEDEYDRRKLGNKIKKFLEKYPTYKTNFDHMDTPADWDKYIKERNKSIKKLNTINKRKYGEELKELPSLYDRAVAVDNDNIARTGKLKNSLEWWYVTMYWLFSGITHITPREMNGFIKREDTGGYTFITDGNLNSVERVAITTFTLYYEFLRLMAKQFKLFPLVELIPFKKVIKDLRHKSAN